MASGIIKYHCANCGIALESETRYAGKQDTCPGCGKATPVPFRSTIGAGAFFQQFPKWGYGLIAALVIVGVASVALWFNSARNTLEDVNVARERMSLKQDEARRLERDAETIRRIQVLESRASAEMENGNYRQSADIIENAISLARGLSPDNEGASRIAERLPEAHQLAVNRWEERQRLEKAEAEKRRLEAELATQRRETEKMNARLAALESATEDEAWRQEQAADPAASFKTFAQSLVETVNRRKHSHTYTVGQMNPDGTDGGEATFTKSIRLTEATLDVRRTDSLVNPVVGILQVRNIDFAPGERAEYRLTFTQDQGQWVMSSIEWRLGGSRWYHEAHNIPPYAIPIFNDALKNMP